jgi:D-arabinose 5-phosphate isomerase GutQ
MASTSDKFEMPIRSLELRRSKNQCSSGYDISTVALHVNDGTTAQMFGFFDAISIQYGGTLFEQTVLMLMDTLFQEIWHRRGQSAEELWKRHANLE